MKKGKIVGHIEWCFIYGKCIPSNDKAKQPRYMDSFSTTFFVAQYLVSVVLR